MLILGFDLGGTKLSWALYEASEDLILKEEKIPVSHLTGTEIIDTITQITLQQKKDYKVRHIGICIPGIVYQKSGVVWAPNVNGFNNIPLLAELEKRLNGLQIHLENDRACYILGEVWKGVARGFQNAIYLSVGTGIGAGILVNGSILRGQSDIAGALGWMALETEYREGYREFGCFEFSASGDGISREASLLLGESKKASILSSEKITSEEVFEAYEKGDPVANAVIENAIKLWGKAAANLVSIFNPEAIIFGGGVFGPAVKFIPDIYEESKKWAQPISIQEVEFLPAKLGSKTGLLGTLSMVLKNIKDDEKA